MMNFMEYCNKLKKDNKCQKLFESDSNNRVAAFITDGKNFLIERSPTKKANIKNNFDMPKGHVEIGEPFEDAVIREVYEETGYMMNKDNLIQITNPLPYIKNDRITFFLYKVKNLPDVSVLTCSTYFDVVENGKTISVPEVEEYRIIPIDYYKTFLYRSLVHVISNNDVINKIK